MGSLSVATKCTLEIAKDAPLSNELGKHKTATAGFCPWLLGNSP